MKTKAEDLINWGQLSRLLSGSRQTVRKNSIPKIHERFVSGLLKSIDKELSKLPDTAKAGGQKENKTRTDVDLKNEQPLNLQNVSGSALDVAKQIPQVPQTQAALNDQLKTLRVAANKLGLYDAADFIRID